MSELYLDGIRVATGSPASIQNQAARYGATTFGSASSSTPDSSSATPPPTSPTSVNKVGPPIPDYIYTELRNALVNGQTTVRQALDSLQKLIDTKTYSGGIDQGRILQPITVSTSKGTYTISPATAINQRFDAGSVEKLISGGNISGISIAKVADPGSTTPPGSPSPTGATPPTPTGAGMNEALAAIQNNNNLNADQKAFLQKMVEAQFSGDENLVKKLIAGVEAITPYANVYFKAQANLVLSALKSGLEGQATDVQYSKDKLKGQLDDLKADITASRGNLDFEKTQALQKLSRSYETDLETLRQNLAVSGKTFSSVRDRSEQLLNKQNEGLVQSTNQKFSFESGNLSRQETGALRDYQTNLQYLTDQNTQKRISMLREAEKQVGSPALSGAGYAPPVPDVPGDLPYKQTADIYTGAMKFAGF